MEIKLKSKGKSFTCIFYDDSWPIIKDYHWNININGYAIGYISRKPGEKTVLMHRLIKDVTQNPNIIIDHINHNTLDNRICNLRLCTQKHNMKNRKSSGKSQYLGVYFLTSFKNKNGISHRCKNPFGAHITVNYKNIFLGSFSTELEAAKAYDEAAKLYHKEFANLNFK